MYGSSATTLLLALAHTVVLIIMITGLILKLPHSSETPDLGLRSPLHITPALLQKTEHGVVCLLCYWLHAGSETVVEMYQNQYILLRD